MNAKLEEIFDTLQAKRDEMEAERDTLQHKRDAIGAEIADLNAAMREIDRMLGRSAGEQAEKPAEGNTGERRRITRMTRDEIRSVPVEHVAEPAKEQTRHLMTNATAILFTLRDGACDGRTLKQRVMKIKPDASWSSVDATIYTMAKQKKIQSVKVDGQPSVFSLNEAN